MRMLEGQDSRFLTDFLEKMFLTEHFDRIVRMIFVFVIIFFKQFFLHISTLINV